ncbi:MAG TPA: 3-deoxy-manno-octulosonate cytidylyltransferase [Acidobacteriota bacterium]|nr:3-deoxy-manno-octulosonate cytidylyltransferase [Acidobacteriota bacterium]
MKPALGVIPARYSSKRFPGKALALINGCPLIEHVYKRAQKAQSLDQVIIATDDERIFQKCRSLGAEVRMTSPNHKTGTERVCEVAEYLEFPIIISIQGDEPLVNPEMIDSLVKILQKEKVPMVTLRQKNENLKCLDDENIVKIVIDSEENALYFSRSPIPFSPSSFFWHHIGIYGFQKEFLIKYKDLPVSFLEKSENLEQLRILENGYKIKTVETKHPTLSVNLPEDITKVEKLMNRQIK